MAKQSNLEKIGLERRNEVELLRNDIQRNQPYNEDHDTARWHEGDKNHPLGKGTGESYLHTIPQPYNKYTKDMPSHQIDTEKGGGSYDIYGHPEKGGGRMFLENINIYNKENRYGKDSIEMTIDGDELQYFVK